MPVCAHASPKVTVGRWIVPLSLEGYSRFYHDHPPVAGQLPHKNEFTGRTLTEVKVSCDACDNEIPDALVHGVINDYHHCTEVRYVGECEGCARISHNVLRFTNESRLMFQRDGEWLITPPPAWHDRVWSWACGLLK